MSLLTHFRRLCTLSTPPASTGAAVSRVVSLGHHEGRTLTRKESISLLESYRKSIPLLGPPQLAAGALGAARLTGISHKEIQNTLFAALRRAKGIQHDLNLSDITSLLEACTIRRALDPAAFEILSRRAADQISQAPPTSLLRLLSAQSAVGLSDDLHTRAILDCLVGQVDKHGPHTSAEVLYTLGRLGCRHDRCITAAIENVANGVEQLSSRGTLRALKGLGMLSQNNEPLINALLARVHTSIATYTPWELCELLVAQGFVRLSSIQRNKLTRAIADCVIQAPSQLNGREVSILVNGFSKTPPPKMDVFGVLAERSVTYVPQLQPRELAQVANGFVKVGYTDTALDAAILKRMGEVAKDMNIIDVSTSMNYIARTGVCDADVWGVLGARALALVERMDKMDIAAVSNALAKAQVQNDPLLLATAARATTIIGNVCGRTLSQLLNALAKFGLTPPGLGVLLDRALELAPRLDGQQVPTIFNAAVSLSADDPRLMSALAERVPEVLNEMTVQGMGLVLNACVNTGTRLFYPVYNDLITRVFAIDRADETAIGPQDLALVVHGMGQLQIESRSFTEWARKKIRALLPGYEKEQTFVLLFSALAALRINDYPLLDDLWARLKLLFPRPHPTVHMSATMATTSLMAPNKTPAYDWFRRFTDETDVDVDTAASTCTLYAAAVLGVDEALARKLWAAALTRLERVPMDLLHKLQYMQLHQAHWALRGDHPQLAAELYTQQHARELLLRAERFYKSETHRCIEMSESQGMISKDLMDMGFSLSVEWQAPGVNFVVDAWVKGTNTLIEIDGPVHFGRCNPRTLLGSTQLKCKTLRGLGWNVVSIPTGDWFNMENKERKAFMETNVSYAPPPPLPTAY